MPHPPGERQELVDQRILVQSRGDTPKDSSCERQSHIDFRSHVPPWACPTEVVKLAAERFSPKDEAVPMRCAAGPAVPWMWSSSILLTLASIVLFILTMKTARCTETGVEVYPLWLLAVMCPFVICNFCIEVVCVRYTIIPYIQVLQGFRFLGIPVNFYFWCLLSCIISSLMLADTGTDNFFGATTMLLNACQEQRGIEPATAALWRVTLQQSAVKFASNMDFRIIVFVIWLLGCLKQVYGLIETLPSCTALSEIRFEIGENVRSFQNVWGSKVTGGDVVHTLGESCCMASIKFQALNYPMEKERQLRREALLQSSTFDFGRSLFFLRHVCVRGLGTILVSGILTNGVQINLQVTLLAMEKSSMGKEHEFHAPQATVSIIVSILTSMIRLVDAIKSLLYAREVLMAIDTAKEAALDSKERGSLIVGKQLTLTENQHEDLNVIRRYVLAMAVCCFAFLAIFVYAMCKLVAVYRCKDALWNLTGCVDLDALVQ